MFLEFRRKFGKQHDTTPTMISVPKPVAAAWRSAGVETVHMVWDGDRLIVTPEV